MYVPGEVHLRLNYCFISVAGDGVGSDTDVWVTVSSLGLP